MRQAMNSRIGKQHYPIIGTFQYLDTRHGVRYYQQLFVCI